MRRGMSAEGAIVLIVVFGIVMIILAVLYTTLFDVGKTEFSKQECRASILLSGAVQDKIDTKAAWWCVQPVDNPVPLKCSRRFLTVSLSDVIAGDESIKLQYNPVCPEDDPRAALVADPKNPLQGACMAEGVFAKEMATCWSMFLEGEIPVFRNIEAQSDGWFNDNQDKTACFVCAEIMLEEGVHVEGFVDYLKQKEYLFQEPYYQYLARSKKAICAERVRELSPDGTCWASFGDEINTEWDGFSWPGVDQSNLPGGRTYAVTFVRQGMEASCEVDEDNRDMPTLTVQILPAEHIGEYCQVVLA